MDRLFKKAVTLDINNEELNSIRNLNEDRFEYNMNAERKGSFLEPAWRTLISTAFSIQNFVAMPISYLRNLQSNKNQFVTEENDNLPVVQDEKKGFLSKIAKLFKKDKKKGNEKQEIKKESSTELTFNERYGGIETPTINTDVVLAKGQMAKTNEVTNRKYMPDSQDGEDIEY